MAVPVVIFVVCFAAGAVAGTVWLPSLAAGSVGGLAFFAICGLLGAGLGVIGDHLYIVVEALQHEAPRFGGIEVASVLSDMLFEAGAVLGLGVVIYLLALRSAGRAPES